ncbi:bacteriocin immunity protein [Pseudomonas lundensis]|uniref:bacteriocin immunity protein n=1 Tax=Pseudomonas lundensis TaxID=86185 RepID=UPI00117B0C7F|nr:bacteriocin immunity protein [Pseudomonas lundensis]
MLTTQPKASRAHSKNGALLKACRDSKTSDRWAIGKSTEVCCIKLLEEVSKEDDHGRADVLLLHVEKVSEHPAGPGLINSPEPGRITAYGFASRAPRDVLKGDREGSEALWRVRGDERAARADKVWLTCQRV